jgi:hypothetical protein
MERSQTSLISTSPSLSPPLAELRRENGPSEFSPTGSKGAGLPLGQLPGSSGFLNMVDVWDLTPGTPLRTVWTQAIRSSAWIQYGP